MSRIQFGEGGCEKTRKLLDAYVSNELLVETNQDVVRHLEGCPDCTTEVEARTLLRTRLRSAVQAQSVPPELPVRIRQQIQASEASPWFAAGRMRWAAAAAACLFISAGIWLNRPYEKMPDIADRSAQNGYIQKISASVTAVLKVGLGDHIHCSVFRKYPQTPPPVEQMEEKLGTEYQRLLPVVRAALPDGYRVIMAHQCGYAGRKFVHLTMEKDGHLVSLVLARKQEGETLEGLSAAAKTGAVEIFQASADRYQVAGFEAGNFFAYVVSDLKGSQNLEIASTLAPGVAQFLV
jgi:anti-sigma factor RsiW